MIYTRVTYFKEPHLTDRQSGIARSSVAHLLYSAFRHLVIKSVLPISTDLVSKVAAASGEEVTATFERVSSYRGGSCRRATAISKNLIAFPGQLLRLRNTHDRRLFAHIAIDHQPLTGLEQWKGYL